MLDFIKCFFCIYWYDHVVFFILFIWWITFIDLQMLYQSCIPGINPTGSWCMIFLTHCCFRFVEDFSLLCLSGILAYNFISLLCLYLVFKLRKCWPNKMSLGAFPPLVFYEILWEGEGLVLLQMFGKIHLWSHLVQSFCLLGVFWLLLQFH